MSRTRTRLLAILLTIGSSAHVTAAAVEITPDVVYGHKLGLAMTFDMFRPEEANGAAVVFLVSGGWHSRWTDPQKSLGFFKPLTDAGFTVMAVRHGSSPKFSIPEAVSDVRRSIRYIRAHAERFKIDPDRIGVYGMSAGGHLSLVLVTLFVAQRAVSTLTSRPLSCDATRSYAEAFLNDSIDANTKKNASRCIWPVVRLVASTTPAKKTAISPHWPSER